MAKNDGIQKLLQAEKEAGKKVNEARKNKAIKLRLAKSEAQKEIEIEKKEMEKNFSEKQEKILGSRTNIEQKVNEATEYHMKQISESVLKNKDFAIDKLLEMVLNITPELHANFRLN